MIIRANLVDIASATIFGAEVSIENGIIHAITPTNQTYTQYILPGFIDAHVHIESSLLVPSEFARMAVLHIFADLQEKREQGTPPALAH